MPSCASDRCARTSRWWRMRSQHGATLDGAWYCSQDCVEDVVRERLHVTPEVTGPRARPGVRLGTLLTHHRVCPPEQIAAALEAQAESRLKLGEQLRSMGVVDGQALLRVLAGQAGVSYLASVDVSRVHDAPGGLSLDAIQALRLVPLGPPVKGRIRVACPAPVPRAAIATLRAQTGWEPETFLVSDDDWLRLLEHYGAHVVRPLGDDALVAGFARERDIEQAVRRLGQVVMAARESRMRDARWGDYVWVRLQGTGAGFDLLLDRAADGERAEEEPWQAATTSR